jgi:hypothetical protein
LKILVSPQECTPHDLAIDQFLVQHGARLSLSETLERYGRVQAKPDEPALEAIKCERRSPKAEVEGRGKYEGRGARAEVEGEREVRRPRGEVDQRSAKGERRGAKAEGAD